MTLDARLDAINSDMVAFLRTKLDDPGIANYYKHRVENNCILNSDERTVIKYIWANFPNKTRLQEIAAGIGQLGIALGLLGYYDVLAIESGKERYFLSCALGEALEGDCHSFCAQWKNSVHTYTADLVVTINAVSSNCDIEKDRQVFQELLDNGTDIIFCPELYGKQGPKEHGLGADTITNVTNRIFHFQKKFHRE